MMRSSGGRHRAARRATPRRRTAVIAGGAASAILLGSTAAYAYWSVTGTGTGAAEAGTMSAPTVSEGTVSGSTLYPGSTGAALALRVTNPNPFPITVTVQQSTGQVMGCESPRVTFSGGTVEVPADESVDRVIANSVSMGDAASNDCQGKTLSIPLTTSSHSG